MNAWSIGPSSITALLFAGVAVRVSAAGALAVAVADSSAGSLTAKPAARTSRRTSSGGIGFRRSEYSLNHSCEGWQIGSRAAGFGLAGGVGERRDVKGALFSDNSVPS
jgi:hypothetical protein